MAADQNLQELIDLYFTGQKNDTGMSSGDKSDSSELLVQPDQILPYLQTVFFEERIVELELDHATRIFFSNVWDHLPELEEENIDGEILIIEPDYEPGSYLKDKTRVILSPLEPGIGNLQIRSSKLVLLRFFTGTTAVELGTAFVKLETIRDTPSIRVSFPAIGRIKRDYREFRVKVPADLELTAVISSPATGIENELSSVLDLSTHGLAFECHQGTEQIALGTKILITLSLADRGPMELEGRVPMELEGRVRNRNKVRDKKGSKNICGIQFDLKNRALAAELEQVTAHLQRLQLRELAEKTEDMDVSLIR